MKKLVANQIQPLQVVLTRTCRPAVGHHQRRVRVLQSAARFRNRIQETVVFVRRYAPKLDLRTRDRLHIRRRLRPVPHAALAQIHQAMRHAVDVEIVLRQVARQDRRIQQLVEILGHIRVVHHRQRRVRRRPILRQFQPHLMLRIDQPAARLRSRHKRRRAHENGEIRLHPIRPHRHLAAVQPIRELHLRGAARFDRPAILLALAHRQRRAVGRLGTFRLHFPRVIPHQVRAGRPHRHHQFNYRLTVGLHGRLYLGVVRLRVGKTYRMANRFCSIHEGWQ